MANCPMIQIGQAMGVEAVLVGLAPDMIFMKRARSLVFCLVLFMGCQGSVESNQSQKSSAITGGPASQTVDHRHADPDQCEEWKTSATFVLVKLSLSAQVLRDDAGYATLAGPDVPEISKLDPAEIREHVQKLKSLPDPSEASSVAMPSDVLREIEEALQLMEANFAAKTPFANGSGNGQKLVDQLQSLNVKAAISLTESARECGCSL